MGRVLDRLRALGLGKDLLVVFTADHGEAFGSEHGLVGHQDVMYDEVLHVPLMVQYPTMGPPRRIAAPVELIDMYATIADLAGLPLPEGTRSESRAAAHRRATRAPEAVRVPRALLLRGWHALAGRARPRVEAVGTRARSRSSRTTNAACRKWDVDDSSTNFELYRIVDDPAEEHDLYDEQPEQVARLQKVLSEWGDSVAQGPTRAELDDSTREALAHGRY